MTLPTDNASASGPSARPSWRGNPEYLRRETAHGTRDRVVRAGESWGMRWRHGPFRFERHTGDVMPSSDERSPLRLLIWQPTKAVPRPRGWVQGPRKTSIGRTGYAIVGDRYERSWPAHARRHLAHWRKQAAWDVGETDLESFVDAYRRSTQDLILRTMFAGVLREKVRAHGPLTRLYVARHKGSAKAGFACVDVPETGESIHLISFIQDDAREASAGVGLMDHWFRTAPERGIRTLDFGLFWRPGEPRDWKGFSRFKSQFVSAYVDYPAPFMRLAGRWGVKD